MNELTVIEVQRPVAMDLGWKTMALVAIGLWYLSKRHKPVYLIDFVTFEPPEKWRLTAAQLMEIMRNLGCFTQESLDFQERMLKQSGCGPSTAWPPAIIQVLDGKKYDTSAEAARGESEVSN